MIDERTEGCIGTEVQEAELAVSSPKDARSFIRVAGPEACVVETGNAKKPRIDLGGEAYKRRRTAFELDYNICGEWLGWSSFRAKPPTSPRGRV